MRAAALIGLGNPGERYAQTRHNIGFQTLDLFASRWGIDRWRVGRIPSGEYRYAEHTVYVDEHDADGENERATSSAYRFLLVKPYTHLNNSGNIMPALCGKFSLSASDITVIYDTLDMAVAKIKLKRSGRSGGHRGVQSIIDAVGEEFYRIVVGIGRPEQRSLSVNRYVLSHPTPDEEASLTAAINRIFDSYNQNPMHSFGQRMEYLNRSAS